MHINALTKPSRHFLPEVEFSFSFKLKLSRRLLCTMYIVASHDSNITCVHQLSLHDLGSPAALIFSQLIGRTFKVVLLRRLQLRFHVPAANITQSLLGRNSAVSMKFNEEPALKMLFEMFKIHVQNKVSFISLTISLSEEDVMLQPLSSRT